LEYSLQKFSTVQNTGIRIITGGLKTSPIAALETTTKLAPLDERREGKILTYHQKYKESPACLHITYSKQEQKKGKKTQKVKLQPKLASDALPNTPAQESTSKRTYQRPP
jgi:hypothetical protein